jgi:hypothetical protein
VTDQKQRAPGRCFSTPEADTTVIKTNVPWLPSAGQEVEDMKRVMTALLMLAAPAAFAGVDASEVGPAVKNKTEDIKSKGEQTWSEVKNGNSSAEQGTFKQDKAFQLKGTIEKASKGKISIARQGLPPAELDIRDQTMVRIDGKTAKPDELKEGAQVRARFQLEGSDPVAVRIEAKNKNNATGGGGAAGSAEQKAERGAQQAGDKAQQAGQQAGDKAQQAGQQAGDKAQQAGQEAKDTAKK